LERQSDPNTAQECYVASELKFSFISKKEKRKENTSTENGKLMAESEDIGERDENTGSLEENTEEPSRERTNNPNRTGGDRAEDLFITN
jgi:hypothetical protein